VGTLADWRAAYLAGGGAGLLVLGGRLLVLEESALFEQSGAAARGQLALLFGRGELLRRFLAVIAVGVPIWYVSALFVTLAPEYGRALGFADPLTVAQVLRWQAVGIALGSACTGVASEWLRSRRRVLYGCIGALAGMTALLLHAASPDRYIVLMFFIGLAQGYWTAFITMATEQFGTNLRGTVASAAPNIVRAASVPVTLGAQALMPVLGLLQATLLIGVVVYALALFGLARLRETWGSDLAFSEG
ncbi:MAG TPA: MFS transporter, partial [Nevskiaceae bacterium]|nr:MFS transporter [Nevskiaceae bacterium]